MTFAQGCRSRLQRPQTLIGRSAATMTHRLAFWDAMLWATPSVSGCSLLLTEDGHDGRKLDGVTFVNPFAAHNRTLIDRALPPLEL